jgi:hypothetical protein
MPSDKPATYTSAIGSHYHLERRWRHKKHGTTYTEIARATLQSSIPYPREGDAMVVYRADDGSVWVREAQEFEDGRFEEITDGK